MENQNARGIANVSEQNKHEKIMERDQRDDRAKEMVRIPEEIATDTGKEENEDSGRKNANGEVSDPGIRTITFCLYFVLFFWKIIISLLEERKFEISPRSDQQF
jgi:hypothetical protein